MPCLHRELYYNAIGWLTEKRESVKQEEGKVLYRRIRVSDNTGASVQYQYNCRNQCIREERKLSDTQVQTVIYEYNKAGRLIKEAVSTRACLKNAFCQMCVTVCGRFVPNEGGVAGYVG